MSDGWLWSKQFSQRLDGVKLEHPQIQLFLGRPILGMVIKNEFIDAIKEAKKQGI